MKLVVDGKEVTCFNDVCIVHEHMLLDVLPSGKEIYGDLHIKLNKEGLIADTIQDGTVTDIYKTMWKTLDDIIEETH